MRSHTTFVGLDVHKATISVAIADATPRGEVRFWGTVENSASTVRGLVKKLSDRHGSLEFTYEAGPCGYGLHRTLTELGFPCHVVAPSRIPRRPGERVKNDFRDAMALARLSRAGELTDVWVPDAVHEAMRDLSRARLAATKDLKLARQRIQSFLLRHGRSYGKKSWTQRHETWLANQSFPHTAQQIAFQGYLQAMEQARSRRTMLEAQIREVLPSWRLAPLVEALQCLRGIALAIASTVVAEAGDIGRFENPKQLMAFFGLIPGEHSSGSKIRPRGITKTGNSSVRSLLYEAAWSYRQGPKVGAYMLRHMPADAPQEVKDIAWKAQARLCSRYRQLLRRGKKSQVAITAVARELVGFIWSIAVTEERLRTRSGHVTGSPQATAA
jgi:transposase